MNLDHEWNENIGLMLIYIQYKEGGCLMVIWLDGLMVVGISGALLRINLFTYSLPLGLGHPVHLKPET